MQQTPEAVRTGVDLTTCDREPIHLPGSIQPHGVLLVLDEPGLVVAQASANTADQLGLPPAAVLSRPLDALFSAGQGAALRAGRPARVPRRRPPA
jgi:light-regulated signal transduction histidine kinase (bacteriophytochrome)